MMEPESGRVSDGKLWVFAVYICYLTGLNFIGLIIAYVKRPDLRFTIWESHFTYAIRTFWLGLAGLVLGYLLMIVLIGIFMIWAVGIWFVVRVVFGIIRVIGDQPIANPQTWLIGL